MYSMNKSNISMITAIVLLTGTVLTLSSFHSAVAQYTGETTAPGSLEEQLKLAQEKVSSAQQTGAYGSGTSMVTADSMQTAIFIGVLIAIFGGVAAAFFAMSRSRQRQKATY
jgi:heme/copper-type cytochrome/quinol oxidase subunit 3